MPLEQSVMSEVTGDFGSGIRPLYNRIILTERVLASEPTEPDSLKFIVNSITTVVERSRQVSDVTSLRVGADGKSRQASAKNNKNFRPICQNDPRVRRHEPFVDVETPEVPAPGLTVLVVEQRVMG